MPELKRRDIKTGRLLGEGEQGSSLSLRGTATYPGRMPDWGIEPAVERPEQRFTMPEYLTTPRTWDEPIKVNLWSGEEAEAIVKPDETIWRGGEQIGYRDRYGRQVLNPPTAWQQLGQAGKELGLYGVKGLSYLFKPFELYHEYVATPFSMLATAPGWAKDKTLKAESIGDFFKQWFGKEGEFKKAYHEWDAPKYLRGTIELIPWFFLPAVGQVGRAGVAARGIAGKLGQLSPQLGKALEYSPYGLIEKALGKAVQTPLKFGGKVYKRMTVTRNMVAPEPMPAEELLALVRAEHPERLRPFGGLGRGGVTNTQREKVKLGREAEKTFKEVEVLRNEDRLLKESAVPTLMSPLMEKGDPVKVFRLKEVEIPGTKIKHLIVTHPGIKPKVKGASMALDDVLGNPSKYEWGMSAIGARRWAEQYYEVQNALALHWDMYIQRPIGQKPAEQYVHSVVVAKKDPKTGAELLRKDLYPAGTRGGISGAAKPLKFTTQIEGVKAGYEYALPHQALAMQIEEYYNMTTFKRVMSHIDDLFQDPMERMNKEVADTMRQYISDIKFLGGGITRVTTAEGKVIIEKHPGLKRLVQSVRRGEVPTAGMVGAVEKRFPELGAGLRDALEIRYLEFEQAIKGVSEAILKDTKITRESFREALTTVRAKRVAKPTGEVPEKVTDEVIASFGGIEGTRAKIAELERTLVSPRISPQKKIDNRILITQLKERLAKAEVAIPKVEPLAREVQAAGAGRNIEAGELTETLDALGVEAGKQVKFLTKLYQSAYKETNVERDAALKQLLQSTDREIIRLKAESKAFAPTFRLAREQAIKAAYSEGRIVGLAGYANKIIPDKTEWGMTGAEIASKLTKTLTPEKVNVALTAAGRMARMGVTLTAALDLSLLFIQGGLVLGHDIARWATFKKSSAFFDMTKEMVKAIWNPKYQDEFIAKNYALIKEMAENRAVVQKAVEYMRPADIEHLLRKGGMVGGWAGEAFKQSYGRFGAGFGSGSLAARTTMYSQMREAWLREGKNLSELGEFVNKVTGVISSAELGVSATQRAIESAVLFAPNYTRAYLMVCRDLFRGTKTASEVRKAMAGMMAGGVIGYVGLCEMLGQEPKLSPAPKSLGGDGAEFMSFKIGNSVIGIPGFWYSALRMMAWVTAAAEQEPESLISLNWRENPTIRFWMGRSSPLVHIASEMVEQKDFIGRNLETEEDWLRQMSSHFLTIAAQNLVTRDPSEEEGKFKRFGAEIFGLRAFPKGEWRHLDDLRNGYAQKEFSKPFDELNREQRDKLLEQYPDYKKLSDESKDKMVWESGEDFEQWSLAAEKLADADYYSVGEQLARSLFAGMIDYRTYLDQESTLRKIYQGRAKERHIIEDMADPEQAEQYKKWAEKLPPEDKALDKYWEVRSDLSRTATGEIDWEATEKRVNQYLDSLDTETRSYIMRTKDRRLRDLPPLMQKIARLQAEGREIVSEYYDQPEGTARIRYRRANPSVDAWLLLMGRVTMPQTQIAMQLVLEMLKQRDLPVTLVQRLAQEVMPVSSAPQMAIPQTWAG